MRNFLKTIFFAAVAALTLAPARAAHASFFFDHNYPDVKWKTFETEHFVFHYYETTSKDHPGSTAFTARRAAKYAEIMYPKVCEQFNHFLKEKVHVVVRDQEEYSNGFAVYTEDWVTIWATPLYYRLRGRMDWVPDVMTHEFSHVISLKSNEPRGVGMSLGSDTGGLEEDGRNKVYYGAAVPLGDSNEAPFWWTEGGAEYYTHNVGYNHWGTSRDMLLRMSILDPDATLTLDQLGVRGDKVGLDGERGYNHGYSIGLYLAEKYGQETYAKFAAASQNKGGRIGGWESVIHDVLGITPKQMWEGWVQWNKDKYGKVKADLEKQGMHEGTEVSWTEPLWLSQDPKKVKTWSDTDKRKKKWLRQKNGIYNYYPKISPDGQAYGYTGRGGNIKITFVDPDTLPAFTGHWLNPDEAATGAAGDSTKSEAPAPPKPGDSMAAGGDSGAALSDKEKLDRIPTLSIGQFEDSDWGFSPDSTKIVASGAKTGKGCLPSLYNANGYEWNDLWVVDLSTIEKKAAEIRDGKTKADLEFGCSDWGKYAKRITSNLRAVQPNWSPDGQWIAFLKYNDGTYNLAKIHPDGTGLTFLTKFDDGTQIGEPRWSPDSKKLAFFLYRTTNLQQDIWEMNADGTDFHPLTWDKAEDKDPIYTPDGKAVLFSSDRSGIFNIYRLDLESHKLTQVTNVLGGAFSPALTKDGNLLYIGFNAYGFQNYAIAKKDFYEKAVESDDKIPTEKATAEFLADKEDLPALPSPQKRYSSIKNLEPPVIVPIARFLDNNVQGGGELIWWDYAGKHALIADLLLGQNSDYVVRYFNDMWYPTIGLIWARFDRNRELGFQYSPTDFGELKLRQQVDFYLANVDWRLGPRHDLSVNGQMRSFDVEQGGVRDLRTDTPFTFGQHGISSTASVGADLRYFNVDPNTPRGTMDVNPRGARLIDLSYDLGYTKIALPGGQIDDGQALKQYPFQQIQLNYVEYWAVPWLQYLEHTMQFTLEAGWTDRNVQFNDELFAGGQHPYASFNRINVNTEFSGYPPFSIIGETMLIGSVAYRMPLYRELDKKVGPIYFNSVYLQFFGTVGNLWSFRPNPSGTGITGTAVTGNNREMPFVDIWDKSHRQKIEGDYSGFPVDGIGGTYGKDNPNLFEQAFPVAYKNGNRLLSDVGVEVRMRNYIYNYSNWFSFVRAAYGMQNITGIGDVNGDNVYRQPPNSDIVGEVAHRGLRFFVGIGTGW